MHAPLDTCYTMIDYGDYDDDDDDEEKVTKGDVCAETKGLLSRY